MGLVNGLLVFIVDFDISYSHVITFRLNAWEGNIGQIQRTDVWTPPPTLIIFNKSLQQSKYPSNWMSAYVIEIFKKGDTSLPSNYGPISLISCVGKLMERIVYKQVYNHLVNNSLIYEYQSGFLLKHSTVHQLLEPYNSILNSLEKKRI